MIGAVVTWFSLLLVTGEYSEEGAVLFAVSSEHGVHKGDLMVIACWAVSIVALLVLTASPSRARAPSTRE